MNINIRNEIPADYRIVEELTREAFWGCMDHPTCDGEHLLVHKLRDLPSFVPELDFVAEAEARIVGHIIYKTGISRNYFLWTSRLLPKIWVSESKQVWYRILWRWQLGRADGNGVV